MMFSKIPKILFSGLAYMTFLVMENQWRFLQENTFHIKIETKWCQKVSETFTNTIYDNRNTPNRICMYLSNINS